MDDRPDGIVPLPAKAQRSVDYLEPFPAKGAGPAADGKTRSPAMTVTPGVPPFPGISGPHRHDGISRKGQR